MYSQSKSEFLVKIIADKVSDEERLTMLGQNIMVTYRSLQRYCGSLAASPTHEVVDAWLQYVRKNPSELRIVG